MEWSWERPSGARVLVAAARVHASRSRSSMTARSPYATRRTVAAPYSSSRRPNGTPSWVASKTVSSTEVDDELAGGLALLQGGDRLGGAGHRVDAADRWVQGAGRGQRTYGLPLFLQVARPAQRVRAPAHPDHVEVVEQQPVDLHGRDLAAGEADHQQPALGGEAAQRVGEPVAADRVEHDVHAAPVGEVLRRVLESRDVDRLVGARLPGRLPLLLRRRDGDHPGAERLRQLDPRGAHATRRAVHQYGLAGLQPATAYQGELDGEVVHRQAGAGLEGHV